MELSKQEQVEALKAAKPYARRLKELGKGVVVDKVWGRRLLVQPVTPYTEMDEVEKKGILVVPEKVKEQNTPRPSTGIVVKVGEGVEAEYRSWFVRTEEDLSCWMYDKESEAREQHRRMLSLHPSKKYTLRPPIFTEGTAVAFSKFAGTDFIFDSVEYKIIDLDEVLCTLRDSEDVIVPVRE